jgi:hypothetical protein
VLGFDGFEVFGEGDGNFDIVGSEGVIAEAGVEDIVGVADFGDARVFAAVELPGLFGYHELPSWVKGGSSIAACSDADGG